ncbi:hypothetical protein U6B65_10875 [Oscillospiraceae bacterium MB08-C2-2]|nr:hypothetical protein U6B65_10875 [Oscillospiraceae bacterium MB08-C2-2]
MAAYMKRNTPSGGSPLPDSSGDLEHWLSVSGDLDDFIFYEQDDKTQSER